MATTVRKRGRPRRGDEAGLDTKVLVAKLMLQDRVTIGRLKSMFGVSHPTLYAWVVDACDVEHDLTTRLRRLALARGLWKPRSDP